jgi:predicted dehydrogenase
MLQRDDLDAVMIATPMQVHAVMSVDALRAGKHVLSEVAAAMTVDECWDLVHATEETGRIYMLSENCCYWRHVMQIQNMIDQGVFGDLTFAECGYVHDCRGLSFDAQGKVTWRGELARDHRGNLYPTHSLGPVAKWLRINRGDRLVSLVASDTRQVGLRHFIESKFPEGHPARDLRFKVGDSTSVLIRTAKGALVDLRYDTASARPHPTTTYFSLQGMTASYDSRSGVWIEGRSKSYTEWEPLEAYQAEYDHPLWTADAQKAAGASHGGADFFVTREFYNCVRTESPPPVDVYDAAAWSAIIPLSEQSLAEGGRPVEIPDFTGGKWEKRA